jgi:hypothetical protein
VDKALGLALANLLTADPQVVVHLRVPLRSEACLIYVHNDTGKSHLPIGYAISKAIGAPNGKHA